MITHQVIADTAYFLLNQLISLTCHFCWYSTFLLSHHHVFVLTNQILLTQHILLNQLIFAETANFCLLSYLTMYLCWLIIIRDFDNSASFCWHSVFLLTQHISLTCQIFAETAYFCWVIIMYLCWLIKFCWHSIFCWHSWFLLRQQIFAYSAISCWVIIRHFDNSASFCWQRIYCWISSFRWLVKFLLIQHIFAESSPCICTD